MLAAVCIFFALAMVVGPIMLMRPTNSQARIAALRAEAQKQGLHIRLDHNPFAPKTFALAVYSLPRRDENEQLPVFSLFRKNYVHEIHFCEEWDWYKKADLAPAHLTALKDYLLTLNADFVGVESTRNGVAVYWRERTQSLSEQDAVQKVQDHLKSLKALLQL